MININEALSAVLTENCSRQKVYKEIHCARNYFLAEDIRADRDYPPFHRAAVDGFAMGFGDIQSGIRSFEIKSELFAGQESNFRAASGQCVKIMTGAALPDGLDVLLKVEDGVVHGNTVQIPDQKYFSGMNMAARGESAKKDSVIAPKGSKINQRSVHSLAAAGIASIPVFEPPSVSIISTGDELVPIDHVPGSCQIRDSNYFGLLYELQKFNISPSNYCIVPDNRNELKTSIEAGLQSDILIVSGGVSMGDADFVPHILKELGVRQIFHNVNIKPGKPLWFGRKGSQGTVVFALPGNPLSTLVSYKVFMEPWLCKIFYARAPVKLALPMQHEKILKGQRPEYFPARITQSPENAVSAIEAVKFHGSGDTGAAFGSDGLAFHSAGSQTLKKNDIVEFLPWSLL
ncbi:MAG: molybdopterin molybdotransferase MoeA [Spirochaetia bacterium]|nr:molybdopterin molybdotransferase MoeA [Spirochaetia bacterium]